MSEFSKWVKGEFIDEDDWNALLDHGLEKPASFIVFTRTINGTKYYYAQYGSGNQAGQIAFGGSGNAGGVIGTDISAVIQAALNALTPGRTWKEKVILKGSLGTLTETLFLPSYVSLDLRLANFVQTGVLTDGMFNLGEITDVDIIGGSMTTRGEVIKIVSSISNVNICDFIIINANLGKFIMTAPLAGKVVNNLTVENCVAKNLGYGLFLTTGGTVGSGPYLRDLKIFSNWFEAGSSASRLIYFHNYWMDSPQMVSIKNNYFIGLLGVSMGICFFEGYHTVFVEHNRFYNCGYGVRIVSVAYEPATNLEIKNNAFDGNTYNFYLDGNVVAKNVILKDNFGINPIGLFSANPFAQWKDGTNIIGYRQADGTSSPVANTDYTIDSCDIFITVSGGTGVSITIKDGAGNVIESGLATITNKFIPRSYKINFGAFTVAPTLTVWGV